MPLRQKCTTRPTSASDEILVELQDIIRNVSWLQQPIELPSGKHTKSY